MIALDANLLVRLLEVDEDPPRTARVVALLTAARARGEPVLVPTTTLVESVWVWRHVTKRRKADVVAFLTALFGTEGFVLASPAIVSEALDAWRHGPGDFADYVIRAEARASGAATVVTLDARLLDEPGFRAP